MRVLRRAPAAPRSQIAQAEAAVRSALVFATRRAFPPTVNARGWRRHDACDSRSRNATDGRRSECPPGVDVGKRQARCEALAWARRGLLLVRIDLPPPRTRALRRRVLGATAPCWELRLARPETTKVGETCANRSRRLVPTPSEARGPMARYRSPDQRTMHTRGPRCVAGPASLTPRSSGNPSRCATRQRHQGRSQGTLTTVRSSMGLRAGPPGSERCYSTVVLHLHTGGSRSENMSVSTGAGARRAPRAGARSGRRRSC